MTYLITDDAHKFVHNHHLYKGKKIANAAICTCTLLQKLKKC